MDRGEEVRKALRDRGVLLKHLKIRREDDRLLLPTIRRIDVGFPAEERNFEEGFVAVRSYRDLVRVPARPLDVPFVLYGVDELEMGFYRVTPEAVRAAAELTQAEPR